MTARLLLGTSNPAKLERLRAMLAGLDVDLVEPDGLEPPHEEGARSLRENALSKASAWARASGLPAIATDGGLSVPGLGRRWRAVLTRRAAGEHATPEQHADHLFELMRDLDGPARRAFRREAIALAAADGSRVGAWVARGTRVQVAHSYDPRHVPVGFWLPGVLEFDGGRRYGDLSDAERAASDDHWLALRNRLRRAVVQHLGLDRTSAGRTVG